MTDDMEQFDLVVVASPAVTEELVDELRSGGSKVTWAETPVERSVGELAAQFVVQLTVVGAAGAVRFAVEKFRSRRPDVPIKGDRKPSVTRQDPNQENDTDGS